MTGRGPDITRPEPSIGFSLSVPDSWFEIDLRPASRNAAVATLVDTRVNGVPELREHRTVITRELRRQLRVAAEGGAVFCACMVEPTEDGPIPASLTVTIAPGPLGGRDDEARFGALLASLRAKDAASEEDSWTEVSTVQIPGVGRCARTHGVEDVELPDHAGRLRVVLMQTFIPVPGRNRVVIVSASSPVLPLAAGWFDVFDAITGTVRLL